MKRITYWAGRHKRVAIALIVFLEITNAFSGFMLGASLLTPCSVVVRMLATIVLMSGAIYLYVYQPGRTFYATRHFIFLAFLLNYCLSGLLGGFCGQRVQIVSSSVSVLGGAQFRSDTRIRPTPAGVSPDSVRRSEERAMVRQNPPEADKSGQRGVYILLFLWV